MQLAPPRNLSLQTRASKRIRKGPPMDQITPWIPVLGPILTAIVGGFAGYLTASWKVKEIKLSYEHKTRDLYLENARKVAAQVYIPLAISVSRLSRAYDELRVHIDSDRISAPKGALNRFKGFCNEFDETVSNLIKNGASAYLTLTLEEEILSILSFIKNSQDSDKIIRKISVTPSAFTFSRPIVYQGVHETIPYLIRVTGAAFSAVGYIGPFKLKFEETIIAAPITSVEFERQFQEATIAIGALIKEVTLGSRSNPIS